MRHLRAFEDGACVAAVLLTCAVLLQNLGSSLDLPPWDEADYLRRGLSLWRSMPDAEWGPLYSMWYAAWSGFVPDRVALFYVSYVALIVLPSLLIFASARRLGAPPVVAMAGALLFALSDAGHVIPRPSLLALVAALVAVLGATWARQRETAFALLGLGLLAASFARPELFVSFAFVSAVLCGVLAWRVRQRQLTASAAFRVFAPYAFVAAALIALLGNPFADRTGRRFYAFCQHFALGEVERSALPLHPWHQCRDVVRHSFGDVDSVAAALRANPAAFWQHVADNLARYPAASVELFVPGLGQERPASVRTERRSLIGGALALVFLWVLASAWRGRNRLLRSFFEGHVPLVALAACAVLIPSAASSLLLRPREHYLVLQGVFLPLLVVAFAAAARSGLGTPTTASRRVVSWAAVMAALVACPRLALGSAEPAPLPNRAVVAALAALRAHPALSSLQRIHILELQGGYDAYLGSDFVRVFAMDRGQDEPFDAFLWRCDVDVVVIEPKLVRYPLLRGAPRFADFLESPEAFGFELHPVGGTERVIAIRRTSSG